jgi:Rps23 Pro-64 3,4-dihydroxylase Tpa1-like proline 4-hydroxylase
MPDQAPEPALKKHKTANNGSSDSSSKVVRPDLFSDESRSRLHKELHSAQPYTHVVIKDLCDPTVLRAVREEVIHNISATYKETDLFKVFQTGAGLAAQGHKLCKVGLMLEKSCTC